MPLTSEPENEKSRRAHGRHFRAVIPSGRKKLGEQLGGACPGPSHPPGYRTRTVAAPIFAGLRGSAWPQ